MGAVTVSWKENMRFIGMDGDKNSVTMDASAVYGGKGQGVRPMELLLMSLAGCTGIEVANAMNKMRIPYSSFEITAESDRREEIPQVFTAIRVRYCVEGEGLTEAKFRKAFELGALKYCSAANMIKQACEVRYSYTINGETYEYAPEAE